MNHPVTHQQEPVCLYHCPCMDGLIAAAIVHRHFEGKVQCVPVTYKPSNGQLPERIIEAIKDRDVYLVDFTFTPQDFVPHLHLVKSLTIIDHHLAADQAWLSLKAGCMPPLPEGKLAYTDTDIDNWLRLIEQFDQVSRTVPVKLIFNFAHSGAALTWIFFNDMPPADGIRPEPLSLPQVVAYAQDYDLWHKKLRDTDTFRLGFTTAFPLYTTLPKDVAKKFSFDSGDDKYLQLLINDGRVLDKYEKTLCNSIISKNTMHETIMGFENIPTCPAPMELVNAIGEMLYTCYPEAPFVIVYEDYRSNGQRKLCFRSRKNGGSNVAELAQKVGGNGHYNSAGAKIPLAQTYSIEPLVPAFTIIN